MRKARTIEPTPEAEEILHLDPDCIAFVLRLSERLATTPAAIINHVLRCERTRVEGSSLC